MYFEAPLLGAYVFGIMINGELINWSFFHLNYIFIFIVLLTWRLLFLKNHYNFLRINVMKLSLLLSTFKSSKCLYLICEKDCIYLILIFIIIIYNCSYNCFFLIKILVSSWLMWWLIQLFVSLFCCFVLIFVSFDFCIFHLFIFCLLSTFQYSIISTLVTFYIFYIYIIKFTLFGLQFCRF